MNLQDQKLRILFITVRSDIGGGPKHLHDLSRTMVKKNNPYMVIAAPQGHFYKLFEQTAHKMITIPFRKFSLKKFFELRRVIIDKEINVIHSHGRGAGIYSRLLSYFTKVKVIHTFHGIHLTDTLIGLLKESFDKIFSHRADRYICVSADEQKKALELEFTEKNKTTVILNGVDLDAFQNLEKEPSEKIILGSLCRFNYQKGLDLFIDHLIANKDLISEMNIHFLIRGDGEEFQIIQKRIQENQLQNLISTPGPTYKPQEFFKQIDYYFSFARWEGLPLSVLEAMAAKKPCLLSDVVGHQTFLCEELAIGFDIHDTNDFYKNLQRLLAEKEEILEIKKRAFLKIKNELNISSMTDKTIAAYQE